VGPPAAIAKALGALLGAPSNDAPPAAMPLPPLPKEQRAVTAVGFRSWSVVLKLFGDLPMEATLNATTLAGEGSARPGWATRGPTHAVCGEAGTEDVPHYPGSCGLYIYHGMPAPGYAPEPWQVFGAVRAWGKILVHRDGFRAAVAEPIALAAIPGDSTLAWLNYELTRATAQLMEVEMVPYQELRAFALRYGEPLDPAAFGTEP